MVTATKQNEGCLCGASQGNKGTRQKGTAYGYMALKVPVLKLWKIKFFKLTNMVTSNQYIIQLGEKNATLYLSMLGLLISSA